MPIERIPIVHKFGIISHSQRLELQERLLKQSYLRSASSKKSQVTSRNPLEVTEPFIQQFNEAEDLNEREKLESMAYKMLHRIKRRAGLREGGKGQHVDLPVAWTELSQLAQCKGKIQEDCLDVLVTSLDQGPLEVVHIPALFFLAETTLYWLRTDAVHQPYLRTGELKLLRMGQLVFMRLFFHHMAGHLHGHEDFKNRLHTYLDGFAESQEAYNPYPNALLSMRYINEVGKMVIGEAYTEAGEIKEGDDVIANTQLTGEDVTENQERSHEDHLSSGAISSSVHDLSPTLWHALDVWRCVRHLGDGLNNALASLASCGMGLASESWVDGVCAMLVLGDAAKVNLSALKTLQNLAQGRPPSEHFPPPTTVHSSYTPTHDMLQTEPGTGTFAFSPGYTTDEISSPKTSVYPSDAQDDSPYKPSFLEFNSPTKRLPVNPPGSEYTSNRQNRVSMQEPLPQRRAVSSKDESKKPKSREMLCPANVNRQTGTAVTSAYRAEVGSEFGDGRLSEASSVLTYGNEVRPELAGLNSWHWEVAITYAEVMADVCLHGSTSAIQKAALLGRVTDTCGPERLAGRKQCPMISAGLLDLVYFEAVKETQDRGPNDWSWRVRYAAMQGLVKICKCCAGDSTKEGLRTVAWNTLMQLHSKEKDSRVLEALKVGQVDANFENLLKEHLSVPSSTIGSKMAAGLSQLYLPPLPPPVDVKAPRKKPKAKLIINHPSPRKEPIRTSLREEIMLATALHEPPVNFEARTKFDLHRIVEDQWRKQLQVQLEENEKDRQEHLTQGQRAEENRQREVEDNRHQKLRPDKNLQKNAPSTSVNT